MTMSPPFSALALPEQFNAADAFLDYNLAQERSMKTAIYYEGNTYSYGEITELANRVGNGLLDLGVEIEQRVALILLDSPHFVAAFFGAIKIGAVAVPLNTTLRPSDYNYLLTDCRAKVVIVHAVLWKPLQQMLSQLPYLRHIIVVGLEESGGSETATVHDFDSWAGKFSALLTTAHTSKDDSALWLYSSGSTGFPKGCVHLQHDMTYCAECFAKPILGINEDDITFSASKLFFAYGLGNNLYYPFSVGASALHYPGRPVAEDMFKLIAQYHPTLFFATPALYAGMLAIPEAEKRFDFSSVRLCISAGEGLPADIFHRFEQTFHVPILDGIGCTEMLQTFISNRVGDIRPGSSGKPVPGFEARIVDEQDNDVATGEVGNLLVHGDSAATSYWNQHEKSKGVFRGHWVATGDKYYQDEEGFFWYCGRADDMLKVNGQWVSPFEVEGALIAHTAVLEAAVVAASDRDKLLKPKAYVVLNSGYEPSEKLAEELKAFVRNRLAPFKYPRWIEFLPELPKTATGKTQRFILRQY
jgi:benzoate-CoA ligase family protein